MTSFEGQHVARVAGVRDSSPRLLKADSEGCHFEFEWRTAAACVIHDSIGDNCRVYDETQGYSFDLTPLRKENADYNVTDRHYEYFLNVCGAAKRCRSHEQAAACQKETM